MRNAYVQLAGRLGLAPGFLAVLLTGPLLLGVLRIAGGSHRAAASAVAAAPLLPAPLETDWIFQIRVRDGRAVGGVKQLEVLQGDNVTIGVRTDGFHTVSVQGYDIWAQAQPSAFSTIDLTAWDWGVFRIESDGRLVGILKVRPAWAGPPSA